MHRGYRPYILIAFLILVHAQVGAMIGSVGTKRRSLSSTTYLFTGTVVDFVSVTDVAGGTWWGILLEVEERVREPRPLQARVEVYPYSVGCKGGWGPLSKDYVLATHPVGTQLRVVATEHRFESLSEPTHRSYARLYAEMSELFGTSDGHGKDLYSDPFRWLEQLAEIERSKDPGEKITLVSKLIPLLASSRDCEWFGNRFQPEGEEFLVAHLQNNEEVSRVRNECFAFHRSKEFHQRVLSPNYPIRSLSQAPLPVNNDIVPPHLVHQVLPSLPESVQHPEFWRGRMTAMEALVSERGEIVDIVVLKQVGAKVEKRLTEAVRKWRYEPASRAGRAVPVFLKIDVPFDVS